ncbi:hypothetical protein GLOIN_2v1841356 [Rhizophagus clarus]|nr:hypothetical protein GLOIN_2v1841356 [Rhizophagus clarus]
MKIRKEIRPNKSLNSVKKNILPPIVRYDKLEITSKTTNEDFNTQMVTSTPSPLVTGRYSTAQMIPIIICLVAMFFLILLAMIFAFHYKRKFNEKDENDKSKNLTKRANGVRDIISESNSMNDDIDIESKRSSGSSFLAIEVMTNTLSNIIKQQGGKIKVADPNKSTTNDLVKVKSLELLEVENHHHHHRDTSKSSKRVNSFINIANNIFGKSSP